MRSGTYVRTVATWLLIVGFVLSCPLMLGLAQAEMADCHSSDGGHLPESESGSHCCLARPASAQQLDSTTLMEWRKLGLDDGLTPVRYVTSPSDHVHLTHSCLTLVGKTSGDPPVFLLNTVLLI